MKIITILCDDFWMKNHLIKTWQRMSDEVFNFFYPGMAGWHRGGWLETRKNQGNLLLEFLKNVTDKHQIDLIFCIGYDDFFTPELCQKIKDFNIPLVNYHPDSDTQWYRCLRSARYFDLIGVAYQDYLKELAKLTNVVYLPMAANIEEYKPIPTSKEYDVMFVGGHTLERERVMSAICEVTSNVIVYGQRWDRAKLSEPQKRVTYPIEKYINDFTYYLLPRIKVEGVNRIFKRRSQRLPSKFTPYNGLIGGYLKDEDFVSEINKAKIVIGINQRFGEIGSSDGYVSGRLRDFEIPACGVLYMAQRYPELDIYYQEGRDIEMWSTIEELQKKVKYYLSNPDNIEEIARNGREKVAKDHTWNRRFELIIKHLHITNLGSIN
jgi:spore maturation protein CgeB